MHDQLIWALILITFAAGAYMLTPEYWHRNAWCRFNILAMFLASSAKWINMLADARLDPNSGAVANLVLHLAVGSQILAVLHNALKRKHTAKRPQVRVLPPTFSRLGTGEQPVVQMRHHRENRGSR